MYLHLGQDYIVPLQSVVAVFDMDTATASSARACCLNACRTRDGSSSCTTICRARLCCAKTPSVRPCT